MGKGTQRRTRVGPNFDFGNVTYSEENFQPAKLEVCIRGKLIGAWAGTPIDPPERPTHEVKLLQEKM